MSVPLKLQFQRSCISRDTPKATLRVKGRGRYTTDMLAEDISARCSLTRPDVMAAICAFEECISDRMTRGYTICFDGLGTFQLYVDSKMTDVSETQRPGFRHTSMIRGWHLRFLPCTRIRNKLRQGLDSELITDSDDE